MNSASRDLRRHLGILRQLMEHRTDYEKAIDYFVKEFAMDDAFLAQGVSDDHGALAGLLAHVVSEMFGRPVEPRSTIVLHLPDVGFYHGTAMARGRMATFFYLKGADTGIVSLIPGFRGNGSHVGRFRYVMAPTSQAGSSPWN